MEKSKVNLVIDESKQIKRLIVGFPDVGLVGLISAMHIIETLKMKEIGYIESELLPPLIVLHDGVFQSTVRVYLKDDLAVLVSEIPIAAEMANDLSKTLIKLIKEKNIELSLLIYGIPAPNRMNVENPTVFGNGTNSKTVTLIKEKDVKFIDTGVISGVTAPLLWESQKKQMSTIAVGAEAFLQYPDPAAAANIITTLNKLLDIDIDIKLLNEKAEDLRVKLRDTMAATQQSIQKQPGGLGQVDLPAMFG